MAGYAEIDGLRLWYDERGQGEPVVLLHGGAIDSRFFEPNIGPLADRFRVYALDFRGHGRSPDVEGPYTYDLLAQDTIAFLDSVIGGPVRLFGYSSGAVVAMRVASSRPDLVERLALVSGSFREDDDPPKAVTQAEVDAMATGVVDYYGSEYGKVSPDGEEHYPVVARKDAAMVTGGSTVARSELAGITCRTLVLAADDDMPSVDRALVLYDEIPGSELAVVPGTSHFLLQEKPDLCNAIIVDFFANQPVPTVVPVRRAKPA